MKVTFKLVRTRFGDNKFGFSFGRAQENPLSDAPVTNGTVESQWFKTQDDLTKFLNSYYWMFFGTEAQQAKVKTFLKGAGKAKKKDESFEMGFEFTVV